MSNMMPGQLSEVELLKIFNEFQWNQIGTALQCPSHKLSNDAGDRLYASFVHVECRFGPDNNISQFQEGDLIHARGTVRFYAGHFVEGWSVFSHDKIPHETLAGIRTKADLYDLTSPWVCMTNAIVARMGSNNRLKTFRPAGIEEIEVPQAPEKPAGLVEHERVMNSGQIEPLGEFQNLVALEPVIHDPIIYQIAIETAWRSPKVF